jgi:putative ABC transport system ATP-binding protein
MTTALPVHPWTAADAVARVRQVAKHYGSGDATVHALRGVDLEVRRGEFVAIMGPSGSGKSTLMHLLAGLDSPTSGEVWLGDREIGALDDTALTLLRRERVGFVFQAFNLLPALTVEQNVVLPLQLAGKRPDKRLVTRILTHVGLDGRRKHLPGQLSGGQQQRVAIARALVTDPAVLFADEPTGALDTRTAAEVLGLLRESVRSSGQTVIMVTHDPVAASYADDVVFLADGRIAGRLARPTAEAVAERMTHLGAWDRTAARI